MGTAVYQLGCLKFVNHQHKNHSFRSTTKIGFRTTVFLFFTNGISQSLSSEIKLFPDETSFFSVIDDVHASASKLNNDLIHIQGESCLLTQIELSKLK